MKVIKIKNAKYLEEYKLLLTFNDNSNRVVDFKELLNSTPYFNERKFAKVELFKEFRIELGDLIWNDYDMCFQAKNLYNGILRK
jgi:hypothetical protein